MNPSGKTISKESLAALVAKLRAQKTPQQQAIDIVTQTPYKVTTDGRTEFSVPSDPGTNPECSTLCAPNESCSVTESGDCDAQSSPETNHTISPESLAPNPGTITDKYGNTIQLNSKQLEFVNLAGSGKSCVLIGAAGTGKTTCQKAVVANLIQSGAAGILNSGGHKHLVSGTPGIVICAYTRRAVANIRRNMPADLQNNCITIHKLLEYQPVFYEVDDPVSGKTKNTMKFEATRNRMNPLPSSIHTVIFEESSMIGTDLHQEVIDALPHRPQIIYLGDIQQLPPVFGPAILGFKLLELPVVELTEVYRQALESPIISLAHRILSGTRIAASEFQAWDFPGKLKIRPWKKKIDDLNAVITLGNVFRSFESEGIYDPEEDIILIPFNKACGTIELNKLIANSLARKREAVTYEIIAGFQKVYLSTGDKVLYDKEDAVIIDISPNPTYSGKPAQRESQYLDYWGHKSQKDEFDIDEEDESALDFILSQAASSDLDEERVNKASHKIKLRMLDTEREVIIDSAGDVNSLLLGYALTVHKSQGSEWRKVFLCFHHTHSKMIQRELLYTAVTRAREELYIICEGDTFIKGIESQKVKGNTLAEKAEWFKGKQARMESETLE
jgi:exodeoxyribonuclease V alpha subunit